MLYHRTLSLSSTFFKVFLTSLAALRSSNFFSLPHSKAFVKNFFSEVFEARFRYLSGNHFRLPHLAAAVKCFFHFTLWCSAYRADSFVRIPNHSAFVNTIFQLSSFFLFFPVFSRLLLCHTYLLIFIIQSFLYLLRVFRPSIYIEKARVSPRLSYRSSSGCSCSPRSAASIVSGIFVKSAIKEQGLSIALSCPNGTK